MPDIDLNLGDPTAAKAPTRPKLGGGPAGGKARPTVSPKSGETLRASLNAEKELKDRLVRTFTRASQALDNRGDEELATAIEEDTEIMSDSLVSIAKTAVPFRKFLTTILGVVEPLLAFARVGSILIRRLLTRRMQQQEPADQQPTPVSPIFGNSVGADQQH